MFEILSVCRPEELLQYTEQFYPLLENEEEAEKFIRILWNRVPELTIQQEKELHKLGRKIRKKVSAKYSCGFSNLLDSSIIVNER